ncbi:hypothetical protein GCM10020331_044870 [Ectobacillus funiculus]
MDEVGRNARYVSKLIDKFREIGKLHDSIPLEKWRNIPHRVEPPLVRSAARYFFVEKRTTTVFLAVAKNLSLEEQAKENGRPVILVSKDVLVRVKADALGLQAEDYLSDRVIEVDNIYTGFLEFYIQKKELLNRFFMKKRGASCF